MRLSSFATMVVALASVPAVHAQDGLQRRQPPSRMQDIFPSPEGGPEAKAALTAAMQVKGWGALPTLPADLMKDLGAKVELCRHTTDFGHGNYAYTVTCFEVGKEDGGAFVGEDEEYKAFFAKKWSGKRAALRALANSGSLVVVEQFHSVLVQGDDAFIWMLVYDKDGCKHVRHWRLVRVNRLRGDMIWLGDDMQEAGGEPKEVKGKCINVDKKRRL
jgi:hypothetical protein